MAQKRPYVWSLICHNPPLSIKLVHLSLPASSTDLKGGLTCNFQSSSEQHIQQRISGYSPLQKMEQSCNVV